MAHALVDEISRPMACPQLLDDRMECVRGPSVRQKDPAELEAAIDRIPMPERRIAWRKAINGAFSAEEMAESQRRVALGITYLEEALGQRDWLASDSYGLADINGFNLAYAMPLSQPQLCNDDLTPNIMRWLRAIYARPATRACWALGRTDLARRISLLESEPA